MDGPQTKATAGTSGGRGSELQRQRKLDKDYTEARDSAHVIERAAEAALPHLPRLVEAWFPAGTWRGREYVVGDLQGTPGDSLSINTTTGAWSDFATGESGGDAVSLLAGLRGYGGDHPQLDAASELAAELGLDRGQEPTPAAKGGGKDKGGKDTPILPVPADAPAPPDVFNRRVKDGSWERLEVSQRWEYRDAEGRLLGCVCRFDLPDGNKEVIPQTYCEHEDGARRWRWLSFAKPRPLYGLDRLAAHPNANVVVVEGEKAADAGQRLLAGRGVVVLSWPGGGKAVRHAEWSALAGRKVVLWPDADEAGRDTVEGYLDAAGRTRKGIAQLVEPHAAGVRVVDPPPDVEEGWDLADAERDGWTADDVLGWIRQHVRPAQPRDSRAQSENRTGDAGDTGDNRKNAGLSESSDTGDAPGTTGDNTGFTVTKKRGVYFSPPDGNGCPQWVCSPLYVTAMARNADGEEWGRLLEFPDPDGRWHRWACPLEMLAGDGTEFRRVLLSMGLRIAPGNRARALLATYVQSMRVEQRATSTSRTGWHGGVYVLPDETIGENGERVLLQTLGEPPKMRRAGSIDSWREHVAARCVGNSRLLLAVSAGFGAPLVELLGDESGGVHFVGASSTGKTTALRVAASVWGGPEYVHRWRATANGLEAVASAHNDALLVLDELAQVDAREAGEVAYMLANGSGKHRARRDGLAKRAATWRLLFLSAGEVGLAAHMRDAGKRARAGQEVRLVDVPADAGVGRGIFERLHGSANGDALSAVLRDATAHYYGEPARAYLRALADASPDDLRAWAKELRSNFTAVCVPEGADGQPQRVASRFALIAAGGELATAYGITGWNQSEAFEAAVACYRAWLHQRGGAGSQEDAEALARVRHFLEAHGESRFSEVDSGSDRPTINRAGYVRRPGGELQFLVFPETFRQDVCAGLDHRRVARVLRERDLLVTEAPDRLTIKPRGIGRCYAISGRILDD